MLNNTCKLLALLATVISVTGCNNHANTLFNKPSPAPVPAGAPMTAPPASAPAVAAAPYVLSAQSAGPYIDFSIHNLGTTDLAVQKESFAVISQENRQVTPYSKSTTIIDMPQPAVIKPNSTLSGRAIFKEVNSPIGKRLVFKPDAIGAYADINRAAAPLP